MHVLDCFCGSGSLSLGLGSVLYAFDYSPIAIHTYNSNLNNQAELRNPYTISKRDIENDLGAELPRIDVLAGQPKCTRFSAFDKLIVEYMRLVKEIKPCVFVLTNVRGLMTQFGLFHYRIMKGIMKELGYNLSTKHAIPSFYGIPQNRPVTFIIGQRHDVNATISFVPTSQNITVRDAIYDLMNRDDLPNHNYSYHFTGDRLKWDEPAKELDEQFYKTVGHPELDRAITVREAARLYNYPDSFVFDENVKEAAKIITASVPVFPLSLHQSVL